MLVQWLADRPETFSRSELNNRAGRQLAEHDIDALDHLGVVSRISEDSFEVTTALLSVALDLLTAGLNVQSAKAIADAINAAGSRLTEDLSSLYTEHLRPVLSQQHATDDDVAAFVARFKPISIATLVRSYEQALTSLREHESRTSRSPSSRHQPTTTKDVS